MDLAKRRKAAQDSASQEFLERRALIVSTARALFDEHGFAKTSLAAIADAAGITRATFYYYFASKDDLLGAILDGVLKALLADLQEIQRSELPATERLTLAMNRLMQSYAKNYPYQYMYLEAQGSVRSFGGHEARQHLTSISTSYVEEFTKMVEAGVASGEIDSATPPRVLARLLLGVVNSTHNWYRPEDGPSADELGRMMADLVLEGIAPAPAPRRTTRAKRST